MKTSDFDYHLPRELIAQTPIEPRDASRLMVVERDQPIDWGDPARGGKIYHKIFKEIKEDLRPNDCLVMNDTRVIPARLIGRKDESGGPVEIFLLKEEGEGVWQALVKPGRRLKPGAKVTFGGGRLEAAVLDYLEDGRRLVKFEAKGDMNEAVKACGALPLPPYITKELKDPERYQTVYSKEEGSVAAPTAGLHFTEDLLSEIKRAGIDIAEVTLDVGLATFRPIKVDDPREHQIHSERFSLGGVAAEKINRTKESGGRVIAVGTTSVRVLESAWDREKGKLEPKEGLANLFIYPGYRFNLVDGLITNFHLPKSTLLLLVSAFAGSDLIKAAYQEAIKERYRFFSFGDAMFII